MALIGTVVIGIVMACAFAGAVASLFDAEQGLGKEFLEGISAIGHIFIPVAGIMAAAPYLATLIQRVFGPAFSALGADPAMAATSIIAVDMGGYQLAQTLAGSRESWIMAMLAGYMAGATIVFSIPVGLAILDKRDHPYMALGVMSGLLSIPVGVFVSACLILVLDPAVRTSVTTQADSPTAALDLGLPTILKNLLPLVLFVIMLALGLRFAPRGMIRGFMIFGRLMDGAIRMVLVCSIIEYFTNVFSWVLGGWGFDPIIADSRDQFRALEIAGYIGIMLSGAFPLVLLVKRHLARPLEQLGMRVGLSAVGAAGIVATMANILAMFRLVREMPARDKVLNIAFAVCAAFLLGDHLAFTANFQPTLILSVMLGKLAGGVFAFALAFWLSVPQALKLEREATISSCEPP